MLFEDNLIISIREVFRLHYENDSCMNRPRPYHALSLRCGSKARLCGKGEEIDVPKDSIAYIPADFEYFRHSEKDNIIVIHMDILDYSSDKIEIFAPGDFLPYKNLFENILSEWEEKKSGYRYRSLSILYMIMQKLQKERAKDVPKQIRTAWEYVNSDYTDPELSVGRLAKMSYMSEVYFRKLFFEVSGTTPCKYISKLRLEYAKSLLETGYFSVEEVSYRSGFSDVKYFGSCFLKKYGISPGKYRQNYK